MRELAGWRPSPSLVISTLALVVSLSGVAVALPGANTINSGDVRNETLRSHDLKNGKGVKGVDVVNGSLTGADIDESNLGKVSDADQLDGKDSAEFLGATAKAADSDRFDGQDSTAFIRRGSSSTTGSTPLAWHSYIADTDTSADYRFGQVKLQTTGTPGELRICGNGAAPATFNWVRYVNGARDTGTVGGIECTAPFDAGVGGDFQVHMRRASIFGVHSGDGPANEDYSVYGFSQL